nr:MAG TPA: protein of unknown function DUF5621 [Caudoviricetes sp.]DAF39077.1 MAG TPA: protein of unknown function (DUF5621) [Caudoviricetes sp.]
MKRFDINIFIYHNIFINQHHRTECMRLQLVSCTRFFI